MITPVKERKFNNDTRQPRKPDSATKSHPTIITIKRGKSELGIE